MSALHLQSPPSMALRPEENRASYSVCLYHGGLATALKQFVQRVWPKDPARAESQPAVPFPPGAPANQDSPIFLFLKDEEVIGHIATLPVQLCSQSRIHAAHWVVGFMVLPEHRNGPIGPLLIKKVNETLELALTLHVEEAPLKIFKGLGWKHAGVIPQYVYLQNPYSLFKNIRIEQLSFLPKKGAFGFAFGSSMLSQPIVRFILGLLSSMALGLFSLATALWKPARGPGRVQEETGFDGAYNGLWERVGRKFAALVVRDRAYLESRYGARIKQYRLLAYRRNNELHGYCIVKVKQFSNDSRMGNMRVGTIVDCLFDPTDAHGLQSLLAGAARLCKKEKVAAIFCTASYAPLQKLLSLNGFIKIPGNLNFAYHDKRNAIRPDFSFASWHLMRGDSDADANF